jgi:transcription termination/antitermination protein NusG
MNYYVAQVRARREAAVIGRAQEQNTDRAVSFFWPRRELRIRKAGVWRDVIAPIFSGYIFLSAELDGPALFKRMKGVADFIRFLKSNTEITPLAGRDLDLLRHFLNHGEVAGKSVITFEADQRVRVLSGPLKGLEGMIAKVDKRKKRIKVKLELYTDSFLIDFGYEDLGGSGNAGG